MVFIMRCHELWQFGYCQYHIALNNPSIGSKFIKLQETPLNFQKYDFYDFPFLSAFRKIGCQLWYKEPWQDTEFFSAFISAIMMRVQGVKIFIFETSAICNKATSVGELLLVQCNGLLTIEHYILRQGSIKHSLLLKSIQFLPKY